MSSSEFVIHPPPALAPAGIIEALRDIVTPHISDSLQRVSGVVGLRRFHRSKKLVGTAFTVKTRPGDNLLIYKALMDMSPGHVLVVDGGADTTNALVGELIMLYAQQRGCAGFVEGDCFMDLRRERRAVPPAITRRRPAPLHARNWKT